MKKLLLLLFLISSAIGMEQLPIQTKTVPEILGDIDLDLTEALTQETFKDLITEYHARNLPFIIARIKTKQFDSIMNQDIWAYKLYSAIELNHSFFGAHKIANKDFNRYYRSTASDLLFQYLQGLIHKINNGEIVDNIDMGNCLDPITKYPIVDEINYYILHPTQSEFMFFGTDYDLLVSNNRLLNSLMNAVMELCQYGFEQPKSIAQNFTMP